MPNKENAGRVPAWPQRRSRAKHFGTPARHLPYDASDREAKLKARLTQVNDLTKGNIPLDVSEDECQEGHAGNLLVGRGL